MSKKATIYVRCSTREQDFSIEDQLRAIRTYAADHKYELIGDPYIDEGRSGTTAEERPAFMKLIRLISSEKADFNNVLCYDVSRFGRFLDPNEAPYWEFTCAKHNVKIIYTNERFGEEDTLGNQLSKSMMRSLASEDIRKLSKLVPRGLRSAAEKGFWVGQAPLGFFRAEVDGDRDHVIRVLRNGERKADARHHLILVPGDQNEIAVVRDIFTKSLHGVGMTKISSELNSAGILTRLGTFWSASRIYEVLTNQAYKGTLVYGKFDRSKITVLQNRQNRIKPLSPKRKPSDWIVVEHAFDPIITPELFDEVQEGLKRRHFAINKGRRWGSQYLLLDLLFCENCGDRCAGDTHNRNNGTQVAMSYRCSSRRKFGNSVCDSPDVSRAPLDKFVLDKIKTMLDNPDFWPLVEQKIRNKLIDKENTQNTKVMIKRKIQGVNEAINSLLRIIENANTANWNVYDQRLSQRRQEVERLEEELKRQEALENNREDLEEKIRFIREKYSDVSSYLTDTKRGEDEVNELKKDLVRQFLYRTIASPDRKTFKFYFYRVPFLGHDVELMKDAPTEFAFLPIEPDESAEKDATLNLNAEDYQVETLVLDQAIIEEDGRLWYSYNAYAESHRISYHAAYARAYRGEVDSKALHGTVYIADRKELPTRLAPKMIEENGRTWYTYATYDKEHGNRRGTARYLTMAGRLETMERHGRIYVSGKPKVKLFSDSEIIEKDGRKWYRFMAYAKFRCMPYDTVTEWVKAGIIEVKQLDGHTYVSDLLAESIHRNQEVINENGRLWYTFDAFARLKGIKITSVYYRVSEGRLEKKEFLRKPYVSELPNPFGVRSV